MADGTNPNSGFFAPPAQGPGATEVVQQLQGIVRQLTALVAAINNRFVTGTFTLAATATNTITQPGVKAASVITFSPTNAAAANLLRTDGLYISAITAGTSFAVTTGTGTPAGTETFSYIVQTPT